MFENTTNARLGQSGVAVGLAWTTVGGQVMVVEATKMKGEGDLVLTGQLGDVMKESATLALSWIRSNSKKVWLVSWFWLLISKYLTDNEFFIARIAIW